MDINKGETIYGGVYNETVYNFGTIKGGTFNAQVLNVGARIEGGVFKAQVENSRTGAVITGGEFYNTIINETHIENATLKTGASIVPYKINYSTLEGSINKLVIDGNVKLENYPLNAANSIEMRTGSTLELSSMPDFRKIHNLQNLKINGKDFILKDGAYENHDTISSGYFNMPVINAKDGTINGGRFENLENHGTINDGTLTLSDGSMVEIFKNDGILNGGRFIAKNIYNSGTINKGSFTGILHNENGSLLNAKPDYVELISGRIDNVIIYDGLLIKGGSVGHITLWGGDQGLRRDALPEIKNEAGVQIEKLDIHGHVKLNAKELSNIKAVELLQGFGKTTLYLDEVPDFSKITGAGKIKVGNVTYNPDGSIIPNQSQNIDLINNSFKLTKATEKIKEQKYLLDEKNAQNDLQNDLQNDFKVDLMANGQNGDILI